MTPDRAQSWPGVFPVSTFSYEVWLCEGYITDKRTVKMEFIVTT